MQKKPIQTGTELFSASKDSLRVALLKCLCEDLRHLGHGVEIRETIGHYCLEFDAIDIQELTTENIRTIYDYIRCRRLEPERNFIKEMEEKKILDILIEGQALSLDTIKPVVHICRSNTDKACYSYFRHLQTVPNSRGFGRRIWALVFDEGQEAKPLMAIIGLSSTFYSLKDRDAYFGWDQIDSKAAAREIKETGLRRLMQLSVCMALPPYSYLHGGKLAALLALSTPIQDEYRECYNGEPLLALVTTSALSEHAPIFNRLKLNQFRRKRYENYNNEMYRRIGVTSELSTVMFSDKTLEISRAVLGPSLEAEIKAGNHRGGRSRIIRRALKQCGVGTSVLRFNPKGLYVGYIHNRNIALLKSGRSSYRNAVRILDVDDCTEYWKHKWFPKGLNNTSRMKNLMAFKKRDAAVSACLID